MKKAKRLDDYPLHPQKTYPSPLKSPFFLLTTEWSAPLGRAKSSAKRGSCTFRLQIIIQEDGERV